MARGSVRPAHGSCHLPTLCGSLVPGTTLLLHLQGGACRVVHLGRKGLTAAGLKAALIYCYTGQRAALTLGMWSAPAMHLAVCIRLPLLELHPSAVPRQSPAPWTAPPPLACTPRKLCVFHPDDQCTRGLEAQCLPQSPCPLLCTGTLCTEICSPAVVCPAAERLDVIRDDMPAMLCVIRKMGLADVAAAMEDELSMVRYYWHSKQTKDRSDDPAPRRWEAFSLIDYAGSVGDEPDWASGIWCPATTGRCSLEDKAWGWDRLLQRPVASHAPCAGGSHLPLSSRHVV